MKKLWTALAVIAAFKLLFLPSSQRAMSWSIWTALFVATLVIGISLMFSFQIPLLRRLAISYLVLTGFVYSLAGFLGLFPRWRLTETQMWYTCLVSPIPGMSLLVNGMPSSQRDLRWAYIGVTPLDDPHIGFSAVVLVLGLVALVAAIALAWRKRAAYAIWLTLAGYFTLCTVGYAVAGIAGWDIRRVTLAAGLTASYIVMLLIARMHVNSDANPAPRFGTRGCHRILRLCQTIFFG